MKEVLNYFKNKAKDYDLVEGQTYWVLSDKLLWEIFKETVLNKLPENFKFLDAGGGTGRWTLKILEEFPKAQGMIIDISREMLNEARSKVKKRNYEKRVKIIEQNLEQIDNVKDDEFEISFNFHNVLGFVENPNTVINELHRVTKKGGYVVSLVPNLYHNIFFNIFVYTCSPSLVIKLFSIFSSIIFSTLLAAAVSSTFSLNKVFLKFKFPFSISTW